MRPAPRLLLAAALALALTARAQDSVAPNANLKVEGIPPIPAALAAKVAPYTEFRPRFLASWHPVRHELTISTRATNTAQLFDVRSPLAAPVQLTDYAEPVRFGAWWPAKPDTLVFARGTRGQARVELVDARLREGREILDRARPQP